MKNRFQHFITTGIGALFLLFAFFIALISYMEQGVIDYYTVGALTGISLFLMYAKDDFIAEVLKSILEFLKSKTGTNGNK